MAQLSEALERRLALQIAGLAPFQQQMNGHAAQKLGDVPPNPYAAPADDSSSKAANERGELATPGSRLGACALDQLLLIASMLPAVLVAGLLGASKGERNPVALALAGALAGLGAVGFYFYQCHLVASTGQSLGKRWSHVRIVLENGQPPGFWQGVVLRSWLLGLLGLIPLVGSLVGLTDALMIFGHGNRCLHDRIAGTRVLKN